MRLCGWFEVGEAGELAVLPPDPKTGVWVFPGPRKSSVLKQPSRAFPPLKSAHKSAHLSFDAWPVPRDCASRQIVKATKVPYSQWPPLRKTLRKMARKPLREAQKLKILSG